VYKILNNIQPYNGTIIQNKKIIFENGYEVTLNRYCLKFSKYCLVKYMDMYYTGKLSSNYTGEVLKFKHEDTSGFLNSELSSDYFRQIINDWLDKNQHLLNIS